MPSDFKLSFYDSFKLICAKGDDNSVDWAALSSIPCYATAYLNTWHVGQCVAVLAASLIYSGVHPDLIHVIGFSLGAHIAGFSGAHINRTIGIPFRRITDPPLCSHILAGIYFSETIRNLTRFVGVECNNRQSFILGHCNKNRKAIMGEYTELR
ncbi:unnamed protein product [Brassicogethes aeneus]|uniref:Lipase domain-containing protein n=1 Tax=Brassicogethes aeneus TaxID=1431903 RepID=A0A9P0B528_BRAAE|nr:unnamed protein product [Brassicogethes aeneus]